MIARELRDAIASGDLRLRRARTVERRDVCSGKVRRVAVLGIRELMLDHVAVLGLAELFKRVGEYQVSSIPGRGISYGDKAIRRWVRGWGSAPMYWVKLDVRDFYGSVDQGMLCAWLRRRVCNARLLRLVESLLGVVERGMAIGSFLSQTLANIYMSALYHRAMESYATVRRGVRVRTIRHALFYMDDMLLLGSNRRALRRACEDISLYARRELGLEVKVGWQVQEVTRRHPIDLMGYRYERSGRVSLRRRIYRFARRMVLRVKRAGVAGARWSRLASYKGYMERTVSIPRGVFLNEIFNMGGRASIIQ